MKRLLIFLLTLPVNAITLNGILEMVPRNPLPTASSLHDVTFDKNVGVAVGDNGSILRSADGGDSWSVVATVEAENGAITFLPKWTGICRGENAWVTVSREGRAGFSNDLVNWEVSLLPQTIQARGLAFGNGRFVSIGSRGLPVFSLDGRVWQEGALPISDLRGKDVVFHQGLFVVATNFELFTSVDGMTWTERFELPDATKLFNNVRVAGDFLVAVGSKGLIVTSPDGFSWTARENEILNNLLSTTWQPSDGQFLFSDTSGIVWESSDFTEYQRVRPGNAPDLLRMHPTPRGHVIGVGFSGGIYRRKNDWELVSKNLANGFDSLVFAERAFVTVSKRSRKVFAADDGRDWLEVATASGSIATDVVHGDGDFGFLLSDGKFMSSEDGWDWEERETNLTIQPGQLAYLNGRWVTISMTGVVAHSVDGIDWSEQLVDSTFRLEDLAFGDGRYVVVGGNDDGPVLATSLDLETWTMKTVGNSTEIRSYRSVQFGNGRFMLFGFFAPAALSEDGEIWTQLDDTTKLQGQHSGYDDELGFYVLSQNIAPLTFAKDGTLSDRFVQTDRGLNGFRYSALAEGNGFVVGVGSGFDGLGMILSTPRRSLGYDDWARTHFGVGQRDALIGLARDPDFDGVSNLEEYLRGTDPLKRSLPLDMEITRSDAGYSVIFQRRSDRDDVLIDLELSPDLKTWTSGGEILEIIDLGNGMESVRVAIPGGPDPSPKQYLRIGLDLFSPTLGL